MENFFGIRSNLYYDLAYGGLVRFACFIGGASGFYIQFFEKDRKYSGFLFEMVNVSNRHFLFHPIDSCTKVVYWIQCVR